MTGKRVKVNIFDINEDLDDDFEWVEVLETQDNKKKIEIEDGDGFSQDVSVQVENHQKSEKRPYEHSRRIRPTLDRILRVVDENKEDFKENFDDSKYRESLDKALNRQKERAENVLDKQKGRINRVSDFTRDIRDEIFLSSDSFINKIKYERDKDEGREIKIEKKE